MRRIGPRSKADVLAIAEAFPIQGAGERRWDECADAIVEVRGLHLSAGAKLTHILATQCENVLVDAAEHERRVELDTDLLHKCELAHRISANSCRKSRSALECAVRLRH